MPKLKTNKSAAKRFKVTGTGKYKFRHANGNHILTKKSRKRKNNIKSYDNVEKANFKSIKLMLAKH